MGLETATYISQLVPTNPAAGDNVGQGENHLQLIKAVLQSQFPNFTAAALNSTNAAIDAAVTALGASGALALGVGSAAAPTYSFTGDTGTGTYHPAAGQVGTAISGVLQGLWASTGLSLPTGSITLTAGNLNLVAGNLQFNAVNVFPLQAANIGALQVGTAALAASGVTYAKLQNESATTLLGNPTGGAAAPQEIGLGAGLGFSGGNLVATAVTQPAPTVVNLLIVNDGSTPTTKVNITADYAVIINNSGGTIAFSGVSTSVVTTSAGAAGGMGTTTGTRTANAKYFWWLISNGSVISALGSTQSTLAGLFGGSELPSGYTYAKRVGGNFTDGSSNLLSVRQVEQDAQYVIAANQSNIVPIASGITGTIGSANSVLSAASLTGIVPSTASKLYGLAINNWKGGGLGDVLVAPNVNWGGTGNGYSGTAGNVYPVLLLNTLNPTTANFTIVLEALSVAWAASGAGGAIFAQGWKDPV